MSVRVLVGGGSNSSLKHLDDLKPNFISNQHGIGEEKLFKCPVFSQ